MRQKREKQWKRKLGISAVTIPFTVRTLVKPNKLQTGLFHPLKVSLSFSVLKLFNMKLELSKEKLKKKTIPILFILLNIFRLPRTIIVLSFDHQVCFHILITS